ncbi:MAG: MBL fold metallo-hydrolase [Clostridiales bacterium]|jgi:ribonuclease BN (tRNA processing enzyme)|nr:MBL fold metallo-hydrolase [Clostridiales bacterium]
MNSSVYLFGTRGSTPVNGPEYALYGGATSSLLVLMDGETIILDAGSGIQRAIPLLPKTGRVNILLTHAHLDHVLGLPAFWPLYDAELNFNICAADRAGLNARQFVERVASHPIWPVGPEAFAKANYSTPREHFYIGGVEVRAWEGSHPGGSTVYRLGRGSKSLVYATDFEHGPLVSEELARFAEGCGLLLYDAQYSDDEYASKVGWGHSTWREGVALARRCGAGRLTLVHHAPQHTDAELKKQEQEALNEFSELNFGKCDEVLLL